MICATMTLRELAAQPRLMRHIALHLTRPGSDFQGKLGRFCGGSTPTEADGRIAVVMDGGVPIGWARSERWADGDAHEWHTLEALVEAEWRRNGLAQWAAKGLFASAPRYTRPAVVAVFRGSMLGLAKRIGVHAVLFSKNSAGVWVRA